MKHLIILTIFNVLILLGMSKAHAQNDPSNSFVLWHPTNDFVAVSSNRQIWILDTQSSVVNSLSGLEGDVFSLAWSNGDTKLVFSVGKSVYIWNSLLQTNELIELPRLYPEGTNIDLIRPITSISWNFNDTLIIGASGQSVKIWDVASRIEVASINNGWSFVNQVQWNSSDEFAIANQDSNLYLVNVTTQETEKQFFAQGERITPFYALDRNASGSQLAASWDDGFLLVWDVQNADVGTSIDGVRVFGNNRAHDDSILSVDWSPNDLWIASGSLDGTAKIWNAQTGDLIQAIEVAAPGTSIMVSWSPDSTRLAYIAQDATLPTIIEPTLPIVHTPTPVPTNIPEPTSTPLPSISCTTTIPAADVPALISAITAANSAATPQTICLEEGTYALTAVQHNADGPNGLPAISGDVTLLGLGSGAVIQRDSSAPKFRILRVTSAGRLVLEKITIRALRSVLDMRLSYIDASGITISR